MPALEQVHELLVSWTFIRIFTLLGGPLPFHRVESCRARDFLHQGCMDTRHHPGYDVFAVPAERMDTHGTVSCFFSTRQGYPDVSSGAMFTKIRNNALCRQNRRDKKDYGDGVVLTFDRRLQGFEW